MSSTRDIGKRVLTVLLAIGFFLSLGGVVYLAMTPQAATDPYTEFYLLGPGGNASGYPTNLSVGETGTIIVGVVNHEHQSVTYSIRLELGNETVVDRTVTTDDGQRWEGRFTVTPRSPGRHRLWVRLYRGRTAGSPDDPYREVWLWINVTR